MNENAPTPGQQLATISQWVDAGNAGKSDDLLLHIRVDKITEEVGEATAALIGLLGENPRKGVTHDRFDLLEELLDVAVAALGAVEHLTKNEGKALSYLDTKIRSVHARMEVSS